MRSSWIDDEELGNTSTTRQEMEQQWACDKTRWVRLLVKAFSYCAKVVGLLKSLFAWRISILASATAAFFSDKRCLFTFGSCAFDPKIKIKKKE